MKLPTLGLAVTVFLSLHACSESSEAEDTSSAATMGDPEPPPADGMCTPYFLEEGQSAADSCDPDCDAKLPDNDFPRRLPFCTMACSGNDATGDDECGAGFECRFGIQNSAGLTWYCVQSCEDGAVCDEGYLGGCNTNSPPNRCDPTS
ncbi:MAG: hypothetical protein AB1Z98_21860 [Nannocystaceae bacterium]